MIDACCESEDERTIVRLREEGYSDRKIAEMLNRSHSAIYKLRKKLEMRFNQKCLDLED